jgi:thioredoxin reductase (NADPH)
MNKADIIVVGAGPVGLFSVFQSGMLGMKSIVVDTLDYVGGQCNALYPEKPIYDIPAHPEISASNLITHLMQQIKPFSPNFILGSPVIEISRKESCYLLKCKNGTEIEGKIIVLAAGNGEIEYKRPPLDNIAEFEEKSLFYKVTDKNKFKDKVVVISGGGDSAADWAIELAQITKHVHLIHRRDRFKCSPVSQNAIKELALIGKLTLHVPYQLNNIEGSNGAIDYVEVIDFEQQTKKIQADYLLAFYGLAMNLDHLTNCGLEFDKQLIKVDPSNMKTNLHGVYAIGDIATYTGKLKLILCGFSEAAIAAHSYYHIIYPDKALHFEYSTTKGPL